MSLRAHSFVRAHSQAAQTPQIPQTATGPIRVLLVICRPGGSDDVPFRSVASRLIKVLSDSAREVFQLDVLRPPTFEQLARVLRAAKDSKQPYHVVHFDGHGIYEDLNAKYSAQPPKNKRGYLIFENAKYSVNAELIHGTLLGKTLAEGEVPL